MFRQIARLVDSIVENPAIGDDELIIAIDHLNKTLKAAATSAINRPPTDALHVKQVLEHVALQRGLPLS
ncbi:hypothetical protein FHT86_003123 [Rhizobium sp. BK313]|jgi:hypothetical protein|uniref:hypothetical protein n=1 Tax=Rhizobium sp. BK313 TaxID=2587081 RepID=UPI00105B4124|nr:hypothetical protein [Rhizobium sp. BK313]MBB3454824.1 hypothetical protein [Rhizobium sp. BK313]